jgi:hypothetical protein
MTLRSGMSALFAAGVAPQGNDGPAIVRWSSRMFDSLARFLSQPEFPAVNLSRLDVPLPADFKLADGMLVYAAAGVLGTAEGLYIHEAGAWKKVTSA